MTMVYIGNIELYAAPTDNNFSGNVIIDQRNRTLYSIDRINDIYGGSICKVDVDSFTKVGQLLPGSWLATEFINATWSGCDAIDSDGGFLYSGSDQTNIIVKTRLSDFTVADTLALNDTETSLWSVSIDTKNKLAYFGCHDLKTLIKVDLLTFTRVDSITVDATTTGPMSSVIDTAHGFLYVSKHGGAGKVLKIRLSDFSLVDTLVFNTNENRIMSSMIDIQNDAAYFVSGSSPNLIKIRLSDFTRVGTLSVSAGDSRNIMGASLSLNGYIYIIKSNTVGFPISPSVVFKIRLSDFTVVESLVLPSTGFVSSYNFHYNNCALDTVNGDLYLTDFYTPNVNRLFKIHDPDIISGADVAAFTGRATLGGKKHRLF